MALAFWLLGFLTSLFASFIITLLNICELDVDGLTAISLPNASYIALCFIPTLYYLQ